MYIYIYIFYFPPPPRLEITFSTQHVWKNNSVNTRQLEQICCQCQTVDKMFLSVRHTNHTVEA